MKIDIGALIRGEVDSVSVDYTMEVSPISDVTFTDKARVSGTISGNAGYTRLLLDVSVPYSTECARCLEDISGVFNAVVERTCVTEKSVSREELEENEDEYVIIKENSVDPDDAVNATVYFEFPKKLLCSEDCKGLCPVCGKKLTDGHSCESNKKKLDSRFAALEHLFDE
jgi:uncharacterized protein